MLVEKIKTVIIELVHYSDDQIKINLSDYISEKLNHNYTYLANLFSEVKGTTIEKFYLSHKIEKVKELLVYDELSLTEIAFLLHYSSVAHLSNQFKKMTGLTPSHFKHLKHKKRSALGNV
jgi:AraC-like DNA-binding protein